MKSVEIISNWMRKTGDSPKMIALPVKDYISDIQALFDKAYGSKDFTINDLRSGITVSGPGGPAKLVAIEDGCILEFDDAVREYARQILKPGTIQELRLGDKFVIPLINVSSTW